jgi:beta-lactam-binding protein with PASTA domain
VTSPPAARGQGRLWLLAALLAAAAVVVVAWALFGNRGPDLNVVPDVVGLPESTAGSRVRANGFVAAFERRPASEPAGTVVRQFPGGGAELERGSTVGLVISAGR